MPFALQDIVFIALALVAGMAVNEWMQRRG